jgi:hypothetical protein
MAIGRFVNGSVSAREYSALLTAPQAIDRGQILAYTEANDADRMVAVSAAGEDGR